MNIRAKSSLLRLFVTSLVLSASMVLPMSGCVEMPGEPVDEGEPPLGTPDSSVDAGNRFAPVDPVDPEDAGQPMGSTDAGASVDFEPFYYDDYESYAVGEKPERGASRTVVTDVEAYGGSQSARMAIEPGDEGGFGRWGASYSIRPHIQRGGEIWIGLKVYWPASFEFSASPFMKFLRLHNRDGNGDNNGYNDLYIDNADGRTTVLRSIKEFHDVWERYDGDPIPRDRWEHYEMYLSVDSLPADLGGEGRMRIWRDGALMADRTDVPTIESADGAIDLFYLFTYWNNERPPSNHLFVDEITIATHASQPPNRDAAGNVFIGDWRP